MPKTTKGRLAKPKPPASAEAARLESEAKSAKPDKPSAQVLIEQKRHKAMLRATKRLPPSIKKYVREVVSEGVTDPSLMLECGIATLMAQQGSYLQVYADDCKRYKARCKEADALRTVAAQHPVGGPDRLRLEALAHQYELATPNHLGAAKVVAALTDGVRKTADSLALHRPSGHSRVIIELRHPESGDGGDGLPWSADPGDNISDTRSSEDEELIALCQGMDSGEADV